MSTLNAALSTPAQALSTLAKAIAALALMAQACGGLPCPTIEHTDARVALRYHESMRQPLTAIRAEARVDQRGNDGRVRGTVLMFVQTPDHVRFDAMTQFGPAAILTSDGLDFALTDLRDNRYLHGPACPSNIARLLGIPLSAHDTTAFLLGRTPVIEADDSSITCIGDATYQIVMRGSDGRRQEIELQVREADLNAPLLEQRLRLLRSELFDARGHTVWRATYDDYRVVPVGEMGVAVPFWVRIEQPRQGSDTLVRFEEITVNPEIPNEVFTQSPRPGIKQEHVICD